jgi:3-oxoacyl-[acyl-carrier protein] reductase
MTNLANKTALVTGANRGMGRATALALAAAGARVIVHYGRNADEAKTVVDQIRAAGGRADAVSADLAAPDGAPTLATQVCNLIGDRLDILVSNAGISNFTAFENMTVKDFDSLFAVNVRAPYLLVQQLLPILPNGSSIVFLSSLGARAVVGTLTAYASTKGAINTLVKYFAATLGSRGIRVNAVAPGVIDTDMSNFTKTEEGRAAVMGMQTNGHFIWRVTLQGAPRNSLTRIGQRSQQNAEQEVYANLSACSAATMFRPGSCAASGAMAVTSDTTEVVTPPAASIWRSAASSVRADRPPQASTGTCTR